MSPNERIADIIADIREAVKCSSNGVIAIKGRYFADRLEAAEKRERGNTAAIREALLKAIILLKACEWPCDAPMQDIAEVIDEIEKASSEPPRNCDVGTADEQAQRYDKLCEAADCVKCPVHALWHHYFDICKNRKISCGLIWAQMPYEEGGEK